MDIPSGFSIVEVAEVGRHAFLELSAGALKFVGNELFVWKDSLVLSGEHFVGEIIECIVGLCGSLLGAQNKSDRRILSGLHPVLAGIIQIEVHLPSIRVTELTDLQIRDQKGAQTTVKEDKVDTK